jgi:hypothetical protein
VSAGHLVGRSAAIAKDVKQPRFEPVALLVPRQGAVEPDERFLNDVFGFVRVVKDPARKPKAPWIVRLHDGRERVDVTELGSIYRRRIDGGGLSRSLQRNGSRRRSLAIDAGGLTGRMARESPIAGFRGYGSWVWREFGLRGLRGSKIFLQRSALAASKLIAAPPHRSAFCTARDPIPHARFPFVFCGLAETITVVPK